MASGLKFVGPLLVAVLLASIYGTERIASREEAHDRVHVLYWEKWTGTEYAGIRKAVDSFNRSQNRIYVDLLSESDIRNATMFAISAGSPPDIAGIWGDDVPAFADDRAIEPLDDLMQEFGVHEADYIPAYWQLLTYQGHVYALPTTPASYALQYNVDLLVKAGFDPGKPPQTIEELDAMANKIDRVENGRISVAGFLPTEPGWTNWLYPSFFGGSLYDGSGHLTPDLPENVRAYNWIQSYAKKLGPDKMSTFQKGFASFDTPQNSFLLGEVAMELHGVWLQMYKARFRPDMKVGVAAFPHVASRPDLANITAVSTDIMVIPRGARHRKEAFEFMKYMQRQDVMEALCQSHGTNSPLMQSSKTFFATHPNRYIELFDTLAKSKNAKTPPRIGLWTEYNTELGNAMDRIVLLQSTPAEALGDVRRRMQPRFDTYLRRLEQRKKLGL